MVMSLVIMSSCNKEDIVNNPNHVAEGIDRLPGVTFSDDFVESIDMFHVSYRMFDYKSYLNKYNPDTLVCVSGLKDKKLWITLYKPNYKLKKSEKLFEWISPDTLPLHRRVSKYDTIKYVSISPYQMIVNEKGIALLCYINGDPYDSHVSFDGYYQIGIISKNNMMKDMNVLGCVNIYSTKDSTYCMYPMYENRFVLSKKTNSKTTSVLYSMDGEEKHMQIYQLRYGDNIPLSEEYVIYKAGLNKINIIKGFSNLSKYIKDDAVVAKLGLTLGADDKVSYSFKSINDDGTCTYNVFVKYASWDIPDADYEVKVNIADWTLL